jgi:hypothetical protein
VVLGLQYSGLPRALHVLHLLAYYVPEDVRKRPERLAVVVVLDYGQHSVEARRPPGP